MAHISSLSSVTYVLMEAFFVAFDMLCQIQLQADSPNCISACSDSISILAVPSSTLRVLHFCVQVFPGALCSSMQAS